MLAVLLRFVMFVLIARAVLELWRMLSSGRARGRQRGAPSPPRPEGAKRPNLQGDIVDAEFEDLEEGKRP
jgi:hypothetical protein